MTSKTTSRRLLDRFGEYPRTLSGRFKKLSEENQKWLVQTVSVLIVFSSWELVGSGTSDVFLAPPSEVFWTYIEWTYNSPMFPVLAESLQEMLPAFIISVIIGIPVGLVMGRSSIVESTLRPWVESLFVASTASLLPVFIILFGIGFWFRFAIIYYAIQVVIILNVYHGARQINQDYIDVGVSFGASRIKMIRNIILPASLPHILSALRIGLIGAVKIMVLAGMFIASGYGGLLRNTGHQYLSTAPVIALVINLMILVVVLRKIMKKIRVLIAPWSAEMNT